MLAEIELLMCKKVSALEGAHFRKVWDWNEEKLISEAEYGGRNIPLIINLISLLISKLIGLTIKAGKIIIKKRIIWGKHVYSEKRPLKFLLHSSAGLWHFTKAWFKSTETNSS